MPSKVRFRNVVNLMRSIAFFCVVCFLLSFLASPLFAQSNCPLRLSTFSRAKGSAELWSADNTYWVSYVALPNSRFEIVVVGDTLELTPSTFAMLSRTDDRPISNWDRLVFDARKIVVAMPLIFDSTAVEFRADEIIWEPEGRVALKTPPAANHTDGITIVSRRLDLSRAPAVPFDFETDNWAHYPSNDNDVQDGRWNRFLNISSDEVIPPAVANGRLADEWSWIRDLTRDRWDVLRGGKDSSFSRRPYHIGLHQAGGDVYTKSLTSTMLWPAAFASKVQRTFAQNPYDSTAAQFFFRDTQLARYTELLSDKPRHAQATHTLSNIADALHRKVDLSGYPSEFVPRVKFEVLRAAFDRQFNTSERLALRSLETALGQASSAAAEPVKREQLKQLEEARDTIKTDIASLENKGASLTADMEKLRQDFEAETANLEDFKRLVDQWAVDKKKSDEERRKLGVAVDAVGLVGTTVITAYAGPAAGAVFAKGWATVGGAVVRHQQGETITNLQEASEAIKEGTKQGEAWSTFSKDALSKWKKVESSAREGKTVEEQVRLTIDVIDTVDEQIRALSQRAAAANEVGSALDLDPAWRATADKLKAKMEGINKDIAQKQIEFASVLSELKNKLDETAKVDQLESALNASAPANSAQQSELQTFYASLATSVLSNLASSYGNLARAYSYYLKADAAPFDLTPIRDTLYLLQAHQLEALASEGKEVPLATVGMSDQLQKTFDNYANALLKMDQDVLNAYSRVTSSSNFDESWSYRGTQDEDSAKRQFVVDLQQAVTELFASIKERKGQTNQATTLLPVPIFMFLDPSPTSPELLRQIFVAEMKLTAKVTSDARIELSIVHPGYGGIFRGNACYFVSFADPAASRNTVTFPAVLGPDGKTTFAGTTDDFYAPFPLRTNYSILISIRRLRVDNNFSGWVAPTINSISITSRYVRY
jgi:hypothetical protein